MKGRKVPQAGGAVVTLAPVLDMTAAAPLAATLLAARGQDLVVDGSAVDRFGAQCLQVLLAARQTWQADGRAFVVEPVSDALRAAAAQFGATAALLRAAEASA